MADEENGSEMYLKAEDIQHLPEDERMMKLTMYTGSHSREPREEWIYDFAQGNISKSVIDIPECVERCFLEILTNASDNVHRSRRFDTRPGKIEVIMTPTSISIFNGGTPLPVEFSDVEGVYIPELIFGIPGTSSHYNEEVRHEAGVNGLGAKLTNSFSNRFEIEVKDGLRSKIYSQVWEGMGLRGRQDPVIKPYKRKASSVKVTFDLNYEFFGYEACPLEAFQLFARHCADISYTTKVPVLFRYDHQTTSPEVQEPEEGSSTPDEEDSMKILNFDLVNPRDYARLYFGDAVENSLLHYEWPASTIVKTKAGGVQVAKNPKIIPLVELCIIDTPEQSENISFVNSMMTPDGGVHVEAAIKSIAKHVLSMANAIVGEKSGIKLNLSHLRPHISMILACKVEDPGFSSQTKTKLSSPTPKIKFTEEEVKPIQTWELMNNLYATLEAKKNCLLSDTDGKKRRNIFTRHGQDANNAGKKRFDQCTLYIVEGKSASNYPKKLISNVENGRDFVGILSIRGKFLNVMNAPIEKIAKNNEIIELKKMLGLREGLDYADPESFNTLRYGKVVIMADADDDGKHIVALLLNFFHVRFPSLLHIGYIFNYLTPIIRVSKGRRKYKFYTHGQYEEWKTTTKDYESWTHDYFKGLGSSSDTEIAEDFKDPKVIHCVYDDFAPEVIRLAFHEKLADQRKKWLEDWRPILEVEVLEKQPISDFINKELIQFSLLNIRRAIPGLMDGFKDAQRKILWGAFKLKEWDIRVGRKKPYLKVKVEQFAPHAGKVTKYHHGGKSLENTIVCMAQDFPGSNNLPYFTQDGQFGTRDEGGKDAAQARYAGTRPEWWLPYIFRREDLPILQLKEDEGNIVEPEYFLPIVPPVLFNGASGIATGYSTFIPPHNPQEIIDWMKCRIQGLPLPKIAPWYRGFSGSVEVIDRRAKRNKRDQKSTNPSLVPSPHFVDCPPTLEKGKEPAESEEESSTRESTFVDLERFEEPLHQRPLYSLVTKGDFYINKKGQIVITELPIGRWIHPYRKWLEKMRETKHIKDFRDCSSANVGAFEITGLKQVPSHRYLRLITQYGMSNMRLLDEFGKPKRYDSVPEILEDFYHRRLEHYVRRKDHILNTWKSKCTKLCEKKRFLEAYNNEDLLIDRTRTLEEVHADMDRLGFDRNLLSKTHLGKLPKDSLRQLEEKIQGLEADIEVLRETDCASIWLQELEDFEQEYCKRYKISRKGQKMRLKAPRG